MQIGNPGSSCRYRAALMGVAWAVIGVVQPCHVSAVDFYWTADGTTLGGSGTWNTTSSNWFDGSAVGTLGPYVSATSSQAFLQGVSGTLTTSGTPRVNKINVASGTFTLSGLISWADNGANSGATKRAIVVSPGAALLITSTNGAGLGLDVNGGGTATFTAANKPYPGAINVSTAGTRLIFSGVNGLDGTANSDNSTQLTMGNGTTLQIDRTNNYRQTLTLNGATVDVRSGGSSGASLVFQNNSAISVGGTAKSTILSTTGTGQINLNSARTFTVNSTGDASGVDLEISAQVIGGNGFTKSGSGTLLLNGSNTFSGTTRVTAGRLVLGTQYALAGTTFNTQSGTTGVGTLAFGSLTEVNIGGLTGTNAVVLTSTSGAGVTLNVGTSGTSSLTVPLSGAGALRKVGTGLVTLTATNTFAGPASVSAGTLLFSTPATLAGGSSANWSASRLIVGSGATAAFLVGGPAGFTAADMSTIIASVDRTVTNDGLQAGGRIGFDTSAAGSFTLADSIIDTTGAGGGAVGIVKLGSGTLALSGSNAYSGGSVVNAGVIRFTTASSLPSTGTVTIASAGALVADGAFTTVSGWLGSGRIDPASTGALLLTGSDSSSVSLVSHPSVSLGAIGTASLSGPLASGSSGYRFGGGDGTLTVASSLGGGLPLTITGAGTVVLAGSNSLGAVAVNGGTLQVAASNALGGGGTISFGGGTLQYSAANTTDYSPRFSAAANQAVQIDTNGQNVIFASPLESVGGSLTKLGSGTLSLAVASTFTGDTRVAAGALRLASREALQNSTVNLAAADTGVLLFDAGGVGPYLLGGLKGARDLGAGTASVVIGSSSVSTAFSGQLTAGSLTKLGTGTLALANTTSVGSVNLAQGTLALDFGTSALSDNIIVPTATMNLGGGGLRAAGAASKICTQSFASTAVSAGSSSVSVVSGSAGSMNVDLGGLARASAGVLTVALPSSGQVTTTTANSNGMVGPWMTIGGTTWAVSASDGTTPGAITGLETLNYGLFNYFGGIDTANSETSTTETLLAPLTTNSLRIASTGSGQTLDLGANRLTLTSGGLISMVSGSATAVTVTGAAGGVGLTAGDGSAATELIVHQANSSGLTITAVVGDNGSASVGLTKAGSGRLTLAGANTFTGPIAVVGGRLAATTEDAVNAASGMIIYEGIGNQFTIDTPGMTVAVPLTIRGGGAVGIGALAFTAASGTGIYAGPVTITGSAQAGGHFSSSSSSTALTIAGRITHTAATAAERYVAVRDGTVILSGTGSQYDQMRLTAGTLRLAAENVIPTTATVRVGDTGNANSTATLDLNGFHQQLSGVANNFTGANSVSRITSSSGSATLTLATPSGSSNTYSGSLTGALTVIKQSAGTLRLTGTSDLTGDLTVASGTLELARTQPQYGTITGTTGVVRATGGTIVVAADNALHGSGDGTRPYVIGAGAALTTLDNVTTHATNVTLVGGTLGSGLPSPTYGSFVFFGGANRLLADGGASASTIAARDVRFGTDGFNVEVADGAVADDLVVTGWLGGTNGFRKTGSGRMVLAGANTMTGSTTVQGGVLRLANTAALASSTLAVVAGGTAHVADYLRTTVAGLDLAAAGLVDVTRGFMTVTSSLSATELVSQILAGRGDGSWTGTNGITSTAAAADVALGVPRGVGWLDNGNGSVAFAYAAAGDTNLDWQIDVLDAANVIAAGKFNTGASATWAQGDFNYDDVVDVLDAADFMTTGLYDQGLYNTPPAALGAVAAVPEPSVVALAVIGMALGGSAVRRRTRRA